MKGSGIVLDRWSRREHLNVVVAVEGVSAYSGG